MEALVLGLSLGFVSGISPGPLMTLVLSSSLERGFRAGLLTSLAPLVTDAPIIVLALLVLRQMPVGVLRLMTAAGGLFILWIGVQTVRSALSSPQREDKPPPAQRDLWRGSLVNVLNPQPWLFWVGVGGPFLVRTWDQAPWQAVAFVASFYGLLVGSKIVVAWATARGRRFLNAGWYRAVLVLCGLLLVGLGLALVWQGVTPAPGPS